MSTLQPTTNSLFELFDKVNRCAWGLARGEHVEMGIAEVASFGLIIAVAAALFSVAMLSSAYRLSLRRWKSQLASDAAVQIADDPKLLEMIMKEMPSWVLYPEYDRVRWINCLLEELWPYLQRGITSKVEPVINSALKPIKPPFIKSLAVREFTLGDRPPSLAGVKFTSTPGAEAVMDINLRWASQAQLKLALTAVSGVFITAGISNIQMFGALRVELRPLLPVIPGFAAVSVTFLEPPRIQVQLEGVGKVLSLVPGLEEFLLSLVGKLISRLMVSPKQQTFQIIPGDFQDLIPQPRGILMVKVVRAEKLKQVNFVNSYMLSGLPGFSTDPFVKLTVCGQARDQKQKTKEIFATTEPEWNEEFSFVLEDANSQKLKIKVVDSDALTQGMTNSLMGYAELNIAKVLGSNPQASGGQVKTVAVALSDRVHKKASRTCSGGAGSDAGTLHLELKYLPLFKTLQEMGEGMVTEGTTKSGAGTQVSSENEVKKPALVRWQSKKTAAAHEEMEKTKKETVVRGLASTFLFIKIERARDLTEVTTFGGSVDPFVSIKVIDELKVFTLWSGETTAKSSTQNPVWNEEFYVFQRDHEALAACTVFFEVVDGDNVVESILKRAAYTESLGRCNIRVEEIIRNGRIKQEYELNDVHMGHISVDLYIKYF